ncbi:hypothetical protein PS6_008186 [Mucor atramentarius]
MTEPQQQPQPPMEMVQGPILIVYSNDISWSIDLDQHIPFAQQKHCSRCSADSLDEYNVSSYDYMSPAEVQGLRVQGLIRGLNRTTRQAFMDALDIIRPDVCLVIGNRFAQHNLRKQCASH